MNQYIFINTADLLLLNAFQNLMKNKKNDIDDCELIKTAIKICKEVIEKDDKLLPSGATKNTSIFSEVQKKCSEYYK